MLEFLLICRDRADSFDLRAETRAKHLDYVGSASVEVLLAGPILDDQDRPIGSTFIIRAENRIQVESFAANDPYALAGLFDSTEMVPYKLVTGTFLEK